MARHSHRRLIGRCRRRTLAALSLLLAGCGGDAGGSRDAPDGAQCTPAAACSADCWCPEPQLATTANLWAVWGSSATSIWAVGDGGTIVHWDGTTWSLQPSGTSVTLYGVHGTGDRDVWAVGEAGTTLRWNGTAWSAVPCPVTPELQGVWAIAPDDVWATGNRDIDKPYEQVLHWRGTGWTLVSNDPSVYWAPFLHGLWASGANDVYVGGGDYQLGGNYLITHWDGTQWTQYRSSGNSYVQSIHGSGPSDVWAVAEGGIASQGSSWALHLTGMVAPSSAQELMQQRAKRVWAVDPTHVFIIGVGGLVLRGDGQSWTTLASGTTANLWGVWASSADDVWAVGDGGVVLHHAP